jgi:histidine ammonia-lyase
MSGTLTPGAVPLRNWEAVLRGAALPLDPASRGAVERGAAAVARVIASGDVAYGVNTGFGKLASVRIPAADLGALQRNLILSHACGVGPALPAEVVRLILAMKAASLARGASGVRWDVIAMIEAMRAKGVLPLIPRQGSVGASGDLAPLAHMTAAMLGEGDALPGRPAAEALAAAGLVRITLGPKEGLALINGTQFISALTAEAVVRAEMLAKQADIIAAVTMEAVRATPVPFEHRIHVARGQVSVV